MDGRHPEFNSGSREIFSVIPAEAGISGNFHKIPAQGRNDV
jgi:hypothetical protein